MSGVLAGVFVFCLGSYIAAGIIISCGVVMDVRLALSCDQVVGVLFCPLDGIPVAAFAPKLLFEPTRVSHDVQVWLACVLKQLTVICCSASDRFELNVTFERLYAGCFDGGAGVRSKK